MNYDQASVISVSDPAKPKEVGVCSTLSNTRKVYVTGEHAYVADGVNGPRVVSVSDPTSPIEVGGYYAADVSFGIHAVGEYVYEADDWGGLRIFRVKPRTMHQIYLPLIIK
jgi:hypothetical protein